ncbi:hypothetical protein [Leptospira ilyithenensis]|uniref:Uncharacterized protein n=1 Tax=Leptospira ilyithenensis TaxID=2484901 RepID=A0A4V3JX74_9LEPT|nr:hypothetical protein [Leptospira ilyithenensis]TGN10491.1 hypothetical protein EHS11_09380 [Leptospira ilyithenensis]
MTKDTGLRYELVLRKITKRPRTYFGIVYLFANTLGVYLEWKRNVPILMYLDGSMMILSLLLIYISRKKLTFQNISFYMFLFAMGIVLEIETQFYDPAGEFDNVKVGYSTFLILVLSIFLFPGRPVYFSLFWNSLYLYSFIRYTFLGPFEEIFFRFLVMASYGAPAYIFSMLMFGWWYRLNLQNVIQKHKILLLQKKLRFQERKTIYDDMHNYLGAGLTSLFVGLEKIPEGETVTSEQKDNLRRTALFLISSLQAGISVVEETKLLSENLFIGMKTILIRRYSYSGRKVLFDFPNDYDSIPSLFPAKEKDFLSLLTEVTNNDLKYGISNPVWKLNSDEKGLEFSFISHTTYSLSNGRGKEILEELMEKLGGVIKENLNEDGSIMIQFLF